MFVDYGIGLLVCLRLVWVMVYCGDRFARGFWCGFLAFVIWIWCLCISVLLLIVLVRLYGCVHFDFAFGLV